MAAVNNLGRNGPRDSLEAASEAAARVNAQLIAKGKLKLPNSAKTKTVTGIGGLQYRKEANDLYVAEVDINDVPMAARNILTRGMTQDEINKFSGAAISTRGRYMSLVDREKNNMGERPLFLHISGPTQTSIDMAVAKINEIISNSYGDKQQKQWPLRAPDIQNTPRGALLPTPAVSALAALPPQLRPPAPTFCPPGPMLQEKVFVGLDLTSTFPLKEKILGPGGSYLAHIVSETGAKVELRGKGSGISDTLTGLESAELLHLLITHPKIEGLHAAKELCENLCQTVRQEFLQVQTQAHALAAAQLASLVANQQALQQLQQPGLNVAGLNSAQPAGSQVLLSNTPITRSGLANQQGLLASTAGSSLFSHTPLINSTPGMGIVGSPALLPPSCIATSLAASIAGSLMANSWGPSPASLASATTSLVGAARLPLVSLPVGLTFNQQIGLAAASGGLSAPVAGAPTSTRIALTPQPVNSVPSPVQVVLPQPASLTGGQMLGSRLVTSQPTFTAAMQQFANSLQPGVGSLAVSPAQFPQPTTIIASQPSPRSSASFAASSIADLQPIKRKFLEEPPLKREEPLLGYQHGPPHLPHVVAPHVAGSSVASLPHASVSTPFITSLANTLGHGLLTGLQGNVQNHLGAQHVPHDQHLVRGSGILSLPVGQPVPAPVGPVPSSLAPAGISVSADVIVPLPPPSGPPFSEQLELCENRRLMHPPGQMPPGSSGEMCTREPDRKRLKASSGDEDDRITNMRQVPIDVMKERLNAVKGRIEQSIGERVPFPTRERPPFSEGVSQLSVAAPPLSAEQRFETSSFNSFGVASFRPGTVPHSITDNQASQTQPAMQIYNDPGRQFWVPPPN